MKNQPPARREKTAFDLKWILASLAGLLFLSAYLPKHPIKESKEMFNQFMSRRKRHSAKSAAIKSSWVFSCLNQRSQTRKRLNSSALLALGNKITGGNANLKPSLSKLSTLQAAWIKVFEAGFNWNVWPPLLVMVSSPLLSTSIVFHEFGNSNSASRKIKNVLEAIISAIITNLIISEAGKLNKITQVMIETALSSPNISLESKSFIRIGCISIMNK